MDAYTKCIISILKSRLRSYDFYLIRPTNIYNTHTLIFQMRKKNNNVFFFRIHVQIIFRRYTIMITRITDDQSSRSFLYSSILWNKNKYMLYIWYFSIKEKSLEVIFPFQFTLWMYIHSIHTYLICTYELFKIHKHRIFYINDILTTCKHIIWYQFICSSSRYLHECEKRKNEL